MIERYVFLRLKKEHAHERKLVMTEARRMLEQIPRVTAYTVGAPAVAAGAGSPACASTSSATPDGPGMAGITVTLRWAGADGVLDSGDDRLFTTVTSACPGFTASPALTCR